MGIEEARQAAAAASAGATPPPGAGAAVATQDAPAPSGQPVPNWYCLDKDHAPRLVTVERFFYYGGEVHPPGHPQAGQLALVDQGPGRDPVPDTSKAPICPQCSGRRGVNPFTGQPQEARVSAVPLGYDEAGNPQIPEAILGIAQRAGEA